MSRLIKTIIAASLAVAVQSGEARSAVQLYKDGPYWSDVNIGAEEPWEFGDYFWWGDTVGYRYDGDAWVATDGTSSSIQFVFDETSLQTYGKDVDALRREGWVTADGVLAPEHDAAHVKWGGGWRMPTCQEFSDLTDKCDWTWTEMNGAGGFVVRGRGAYSASSIFLPAAGWGNDSIHNINEASYYWSVTPNRAKYAEMLLIYRYADEETGYSADHTDRYYGVSIRPVRTNASTGDGVEWLDEKSATTGRTGVWATPVEYGADGRAYLDGANAFTPHNSSTGNVVTVEMTAQFCEYVGDAEPDATAQAAVRLGTNGCFQVWAGEKLGVESGGVGELGWVDVEAEGVVPVSGAEYSLRTTFDYSANTFSVAIKNNDVWLPLTSSTPNSNFPLAAATNCVTSIGFIGDTLFTSMSGDCRMEVVGEFATNEVVMLMNNAPFFLNTAKAAWLNKLGTKTTVEGKLSGMRLDDVNKAYLLNLDLDCLDDVEGSYSFQVTDINVGTDSVAVSVTLTRSGQVEQKINGTLNFYGAATLAAFKEGATKLGGASLTNESFAGGETATATIHFDGETPPAFFNAKIEEE